MECLGRRDQPEQRATEAHRLPLPAAVVAVEGVAMERVAAEAAEEAALSSQMMIYHQIFSITIMSTITVIINFGRVFII
jgi:hypothetical protein